MAPALRMGCLPCSDNQRIPNPCEGENTPQRI